MAVPEVLSLRLDTALHERLTLVADVLETSVSAVIRDAISAHVDGLLADEAFRNRVSDFFEGQKAILLAPVKIAEASR